MRPSYGQPNSLKSISYLLSFLVALVIIIIIPWVGLSTIFGPSAQSTPTVAATPTALSRATPSSLLTPTPTEEPRYHIVEKGDTLYNIALQYGVTIEAVETANEISKTQTIYPGQKLRIP